MFFFNPSTFLLSTADTAGAAILSYEVETTGRGRQSKLGAAWVPVDHGTAVPAWDGSLGRTPLHLPEREMNLFNPLIWEFSVTGRGIQS